MIKNLLFLSLATIIFGQNNRIENIDISTKKNGVSIKILANFSIQPSQITGWYNQSNSWYYITIYNAFGDTVSLGKTKTNYSGGIQGGISNGNDIYCEVSFKPVSTLMKKQESIDWDRAAIYWSCSRFYNKT